MKKAYYAMNCFFIVLGVLLTIKTLNRTNITQISVNNKNSDSPQLKVTVQNKKSSDDKALRYIYEKNLFNKERKEKNLYEETKTMKQQLPPTLLAIVCVDNNKSALLKFYSKQTAKINVQWYNIADKLGSGFVLKEIHERFVIIDTGTKNITLKIPDSKENTIRRNRY